MIQLILGRDGRERSAALYDAMLTSEARVKILLVPDQYSFEAERELIEKRKLPGLFSIEVLSFKRLIYRVQQEVGYLPGDPIDRAGKLLLLRRVIQKTDLTYYEKSAHRRGFLSTMAGQIEDFKHSGIDDVVLDRVADRLTNPLLTGKLGDLSALYRGYEEALGDVYYDDAALYRHFADIAPQAPILRDAHLFIDRFDGFTAADFEVLASLFDVVPQVTISLLAPEADHAPDAGLFLPVVEARERLATMAAERQIPLETRLIADHGGSDLRTFLMKNLFAYPFNVRSDSDESLSLTACGDVTEEVRLLATKIQALARQGMRYGDMAVVTSSMADYRRLVARLFKRHEIPYFIDELVGLENNPLVLYLVSMLRAMDRGYPMTEMMTWMKTPFVEADLATFENFALARGYRGKKWTLPIEDNEALETLRRTVLEPFFGLHDALRREKTVARRIEIIGAYLNDHRIHERQEALVVEMEEAGLLEKALENAQVWQILTDLFHQLSQLMGEETLSFRAFVDLVESALSEHELGIIPPASDAVMVGTLRRSKLSHPRVLFVLGMNDGRFPADTTDEVIFMAEELADLEREGLPPLMSVHLREEKDRIKIYELFTTPTEALVLSYPESDEEGKVLKPALLTERLRQMLPGVFVNAPQQDPYSLAGSVEDQMLADLRWSLDRGRVDERALSALAYFDREEPDKAEWYREALLYDNRAGNLSPQTVEKLYRGGPTLSVSALETFRQCPFRYTLQYGLRPRPRDTYEVNAMDIGTLFHGVVEQLIERMRATGLPLDELTPLHMNSLVDDIVSETARTTKKRGIFEETARNQHLLEKVRRVARRSAQVILYQVQRGDFEPRAFELAFGDREQIPPMVFELPGGRFLKLRGVIDRVDLYERDGKTYVEIIDYKSGKKAFDLSEVYHGLQLQLLVYLRALLYNPQLFEAGGLEPAAVFYFKIDDPLVAPQDSEEALAEALLKALSLDGLMVGDVSLVTAMDRDFAVKHDSPLIPAKLKKDGDFNAHSKVLAEPAFFQLLDHVEHTVKEIGGRILAGEAAIRPVNHGAFEACRFCDFGHICQFDRRFHGNEPERLLRMKKDVVIEAIEKEETDHA